MLFRALCYLVSGGVAVVLAVLATTFGHIAEPNEASPLDPMIFFGMFLIPQLGLLLAPTAATRPSLLLRTIAGLGLLPPLAWFACVLAENLGLFGKRPESPLMLFVSLAGVSMYSWALYRVARGPQEQHPYSAD